MSDNSQPSKRLLKSLDRIKRRGGCALVNHGPLGGDTTFHLKDGGEVSKSTVSLLLSFGLLQSGHDGLLDGTEQTYHAV